MADLDFLKYFKPADLITPLSVGMKMTEDRQKAKDEAATSADQMLERHQNADTQRMFAQNTAQRESAQEMRAKQEWDNRLSEQKRQHGIEDANAVQTIGMLNMTNPGAAAALAAAHGGYLNPLTATTLAAAERAPSPDEQLDQALGGPSGSPGAPAADAAAPSEPAIEGPQESPEIEERMHAAKPDADLESLMARSIPATVAEGSREEAPRAPAAAPNPLLEVVMGGQHYPLPTRSPGTGLGDKYDKIYQSLTQSGAMTPREALKHVSGLFSDDNKAANTSSRIASEIDQREADREKYGNQFSLTADQRQGNVETAEQGRNRRNADNNKARLEVAALMGGPKQEQADTGKRAQYMGVVKEAEGIAGSNKDIAALKNLEKIKGELGPNSSAAAQNTAADTLAQIAQGGKAGIAVMNVINKHSLGPIENMGDKAYQLTHNGRHSPAWIKSVNGAALELRDVQKDLAGREFDAFEDAAGSRSAYAKDPEVAPHVEEQRKKFGRLLGVQVPQGGPSDSEKLQQIMNGLGIK